jgi:hypothetical protein
VLVELGGRLKRCMADNISPLGMLFLAAEPYRLGEQLTITFLHPATDLEIQAEAEVIHVTWDPAGHGGGTFKIGVRFDHFSHDSTHPPLRCLPC